MSPQVRHASESWHPGGMHDINVEYIFIWFLDASFRWHDSVGVTTMLAPRHEIARLHSDFYRDQFRKVLRWLIYSISIIFLLIALIIYLILFQPAASYYGNTSEGRILPMPPAQVV